MPLSISASDLLGCPSTYHLLKVNCLEPLDPLSIFLSKHNDLEYSHQTMLSPLSLAALENQIDVVHFLNRFQEENIQKDRDLALFLANRQGHREMAILLESLKANPARESSPNGLHGAAWRGLNNRIRHYILKDGASPEVTDGSSATPVLYAILGPQDEQGAWETIKVLLQLEASPLATFGSQDLSYADIARMEGKKDLAEKLEEACPSPTILNSSRESSCTPRGGKEIQPHNKRPREDSEVDGGAKRACRVERCASEADISVS
ncbi:hypothetical protein AU210_007150 [Fusarium oxysporum f. sp. radicis-cucumerinum]|uniref:Uncharacterized protein n=1 Tax=Fusarium oxysporum f. sp. radicis-cucumerinum TaxID=327505 RepID=A0A2H3HLZ7_FUSOX|nr:hypothetical protein AU210_007150 [Fusarium oxysporum f. sp. radicis-cucumerinum]